MATIGLLVDTDVFIDYFNSGSFASILDSRRFAIYYTAVTRQELLAKRGLRSREKEAILEVLGRHRLIRLDSRIAARYSSLRTAYRNLPKEDALIAAAALVKRLPLLTRNWRHYRQVGELVLFTGRHN
ncbi:MAG: PIN domain-containing protein [Candidatus Binatia bacterium]